MVRSSEEAVGLRPWINDDCNVYNAFDSACTRCMSVVKTLLKTIDMYGVQAVLKATVSINVIVHPQAEDHDSSTQCLHRIKLRSGSLLIMGGATQLHWEHRLPLDATSTSPRINLTFRKVWSPEASAAAKGDSAKAGWRCSCGWQNRASFVRCGGGGAARGYGCGVPRSGVRCMGV